MNKNEEKVVQAAVDYAAVLLSENGARVLNASPRRMAFEADNATWELHIDKKPFQEMYIPCRSDAMVVATPQTLRDVVAGVDSGDMTEQRRNAIQKYIRQFKENEWIFEITVDPVERRLRVGDYPSENSQIAVGVPKYIHLRIEDAHVVAEALVEMCNAFVAQSVWTLALYQKPAGSQNWTEAGKRREVYGVSHLLTAMIELLTRRELIPPGHGLCAVTLVGMGL